MPESETHASHKMISLMGGEQIICAVCDACECHDYGRAMLSRECVPWATD